MIVDKVFCDVYLSQENYELMDDAGPLSMKTYSVLDVNLLSIEQISVFIDKMVEDFTDFSPYGSCRSIRIRDVCKNGDDGSVRYVAVCGECHRDCHDAVRIKVKAKVSEIAGTSVIYVEKPVNLSVQKKNDMPNLSVYRPR